MSFMRLSTSIIVTQLILIIRHWKLMKPKLIKKTNMKCCTLISSKIMIDRLMLGIYYQRTALGWNIVGSVGVPQDKMDPSYGTEITMQYWTHK